MSPDKKSPVRTFEPSLQVWLRAAADVLERGHVPTERQRTQLVDALRQSADIAEAKP